MSDPACTHPSYTDGYCDVCGHRDSTPAAETCPDCGALRGGRFCEECGYDFATGETHGEVSAPVTQRPEAYWYAVVRADRGYYQRVIELGGPDAGHLVFPPYCPERSLMLTEKQVLIGRRSTSRGIIPVIDLAGPPEDPGVSHVHAVLLARDDAWALVDPGSTNGTCLNGADEPIPVNEEVPIGDGDRIHVGAWTTIQLRKGTE